MFTKISRPTAEPVVQNASVAKASEKRGARDDRRPEPARDELANMMQAHVTSLDAIVQGFATWGAFSV